MTACHCQILGNREHCFEIIACNTVVGVALGNELQNIMGVELDAVNGTDLTVVDLTGVQVSISGDGIAYRISLGDSLSENILQRNGSSLGFGTSSAESNDRYGSDHQYSEQNAQKFSHKNSS